MIISLKDKTITSHKEYIFNNDCLILYNDTIYYNGRHNSYMNRLSWPGYKISIIRTTLENKNTGFIRDQTTCRRLFYGDVYLNRNVLNMNMFNIIRLTSTISYTPDDLNNLRISGLAVKSNIRTDIPAGSVFYLHLGNYNDYGNHGVLYGNEINNPSIIISKQPPALYESQLPIIKKLYVPNILHMTDCTLFNLKIKFNTFK